MAEKKALGRPRKLDEVKQRRLLRLVMAGGSLQDAAKVVGCSRRTVHRATRRDPMFDWRLRLALKVRRSQRRMIALPKPLLGHAEASCPSTEGRSTQSGDNGHTVTAGQMLKALSDEVRRLWQAETPSANGDKTLTPDSAVGYVAKSATSVPNDTRPEGDKTRHPTRPRPGGQDDTGAV